MSVRERRNRKDSRGKTPDQLRRALPWVYLSDVKEPTPSLIGTPLTGAGYIRAVHYQLNGRPVTRDELAAYFRSLDIPS